MANPPQVRPWFRLASIRSVPAPAPAPVSDTRPIPTTTSRTSSVPSSPQNQPSQPQEKTAERTSAPPSPPRSPPHTAIDRKSSPSPPSQPHKDSASLPTSPLQKAPLTSSPTRKPPSSSSSPSPSASPKTIKQTDHSPVHSPSHRTTLAPPSPLILPPSQLKAEPKIPAVAEPKTVLVQTTIDKHEPKLHRETGETWNHANAHHREKPVNGRESTAKGKSVHRKVAETEDSAMRVITITGENRGAYMELVHSPNKHELNYLHKKGNSNGNKVGGVESGASSSDEGNSKKKDKNHRGRITSSFPMAAYMNSNVQCVNNSLLYHTSCSHHDPGVRLSLSKKPFGEGFHLKEHVHGQNT